MVAILTDAAVRCSANNRITIEVPDSIDQLPERQVMEKLALAS